MNITTRKRSSYFRPTYHYVEAVVLQAWLMRLALLSSGSSRLVAVTHKTFARDQSRKINKSRNGCVDSCCAREPTGYDT
jgi:hypothetical protein